jgi:hypothetical protein
LGRDLIPGLLDLSGTVLPEGLEALIQLLLEALPLSAHLVEGLTQALLFGHGLCAISLKTAQLGLKEIDAGTRFLLLLFELALEFVKAFFSDGSLQGKLVGDGANEVLARLGQTFEAEIA